MLLIIVIDIHVLTLLTAIIIQRDCCGKCSSSLRTMAYTFCGIIHRRWLSQIHTTKIVQLTSSWANTSGFGWHILEISWENAIKN